MKKIHPLRLFVKTVFIFVLANLIFALWNPSVGRLSAYNTVFQGRTRFPYGVGERTIAIDDLDALFASHEISAPKEENEFRVILIGDSSVWGDELESDQTFSTKLNESQLECASKDIRFYNIGFPHLAIVKDLIFLSKAMEYQPDAVIWTFTLRTVLPKTPNPFLKANAERVLTLMDEYHLVGYPYEDLDYRESTLYERTFIGQRSELARILSLQTLGSIWISAESDTAITFAQDNAPIAEPIIDPNDLENKISYLGFDEPANIIPSLWLDYFDAGEEIVGDIPILFVNQPMFIATGANSDIRYNQAYPRWAYDQYRAFLFTDTEATERAYLDLWNAIDPEYFIGHTFHLSPEGEKLMAEALGANFQEAICNKK